jgi:hypothetical protein
MEVLGSTVISNWNQNPWVTCAVARAPPVAPIPGIPPPPPIKQRRKLARAKATKSALIDASRNPASALASFEGAQIRIPEVVSSVDLDWENSRPLNSWPTGPRDWVSRERHSIPWRNRPVSLMQLRTAHVLALIQMIGGSTIQGGASLESNRASNKAQTKSASTSGEESRAVGALASYLKENGQATRAQANEWCRGQGYSLGKRAFGRVWHQAREQGGLTRIAPSGRKRISSR